MFLFVIKMSNYDVYIFFHTDFKTELPIELIGYVKTPYYAIFYYEHSGIQYCHKLRRSQKRMRNLITLLLLGLEQCFPLRF